MTESMIEKVAEALMKVPLEEKNSDYYALARAALEAMREPTERMTEAACAECHRMSGCIDPVIHVWDAMIDAALIWPPGSADIAGVPMARD